MKDTCWHQVENAVFNLVGTSQMLNFKIKFSHTSSLVQMCYLCRQINKSTQKLYRLWKLYQLNAAPTRSY